VAAAAEGPRRDGGLVLERIVPGVAVEVDPTDVVLVESPPVAVGPVERDDVTVVSVVIDSCIVVIGVTADGQDAVGEGRRGDTHPLAEFQGVELRAGLAIGSASHRVTLPFVGVGPHRGPFMVSSGYIGADSRGYRAGRRGVVAAGRDRSRGLDDDRAG